MRILITGGSGYLATELANYLCNDHEITLAGRSDRHPAYLSKVQYRQIDWGNRQSLETLCVDQEVVIHASGMNSGDSEKDPTAAYRVNVSQTKSLAEVAKISRVKKFIYLSTVHVYSDFLCGVFDEDSPTLNPKFYAMTHRLGEKRALELSDESFCVMALRLANIYGSSLPLSTQRSSLAIHNFIAQAIKTGNIVVESPGETMRNFFPLHRLKPLIAHLISADSQIFKSGTFNVTWPYSYSLFQITELVKANIEKILGFSPKINMSEIHSEGSYRLSFESKLRYLISENPHKDFLFELALLIRLIYEESLEGQSPDV